MTDGAGDHADAAVRRGRPTAEAQDKRGGAMPSTSRPALHLHALWPFALRLRRQEIRACWGARRNLLGKQHSTTAGALNAVGGCWSRLSRSRCEFVR